MKKTEEEVYDDLARVAMEQARRLEAEKKAAEEAARDKERRDG